MLELYRRWNVPLFPCWAKDKTPATPRGFYDATFDSGRWRAWFADERLSIGLPTGAPSRVVVMDIDPRNGGDASLAALVARHGPVPDTVQSFTGGGGQHFFFRMTRPMGGFKLADGIDIKATGGYVVVPPSKHPSGRRYAWMRAPDETALADVPAWLCAEVRDRPSEPIRLEARSRESGDARMRRFFIAVAGRICDRMMGMREGARNDYLNRAAFGIGQFAHVAPGDAQWALDRLRACAIDAGLNPREIDKTIASGYRSGERHERRVELAKRHG